MQSVPNRPRSRHGPTGAEVERPRHICVKNLVLQFHTTDSECFGVRLQVAKKTFQLANQPFLHGTPGIKIIQWERDCKSVMVESGEGLTARFRACAHHFPGKLPIGYGIRHCVSSLWST